jgi:LuxR family maltose regulon positive regulatory protein
VARLLLAQGQASAAQSLLRQIEQTAQQQGRLGTLVAIQVLQALTEKALHRHGPALERLEHALSLAAHSGYRRAFLDEGASMAALLAERRTVAPDFVDALIAALPKPAAVDAPGAATASAAANQALIEPLSETQLAILRLVAEGLSNQEIADKLGITVGTTKWHLNQIYGKLGVTSRTQAVAHGRKVSLL